MAQLVPRNEATWSPDQSGEDSKCLFRQDYRVAIPPQLSRLLVKLTVAEFEPWGRGRHPGGKQRKAVSILHPASRAGSLVRLPVFHLDVSLLSLVHRCAPPRLVAAPREKPMNWNGTTRHVLIAVILLLCPLPGEAAKRRALSPHKASCMTPNAGHACTLAFVSERDGNSEIYLINVDGTGLLRLTDDAGLDVDPAWSPDGKRIAFTSDRSGELDIYIMDADGSNVVRRTHGGRSQTPAWSADGKRITFASVRNGHLGIYVMTAAGDPASPTLVGHDRGWNADPAWSHDGERIAFASDWRAFDFLYDIYVMKADGSEITTLLEGPFFGPWTFYFQPSWSADGGKIAVVVCTYAWDNCFPGSSIAVANADGSELRTLVQTGGYAAPAWSPEGSTIAFSSQPCRSCVAELRYVSADGSRSGVIFWNGHDPAWRP